MRKHYIDNLRNLAILLLFPVHTCMIWNDFGSRFYIWAGVNKLFSTLIVLINPWFMPLLFVLAGISARCALAQYAGIPYACEQRALAYCTPVKEFAVKRARKLLLPFAGGMVLLVPFQTLYARKYFDGYSGSVWENLRYFFTHVTDLSGYDGAFTPGHLWFILFLFLIAMLSLVLFRFLPFEKAVKKVEKIPAAGVLCLFVPVWLMYYLGNFGGFSLGKSLALYLAGYYVLSSDAVLERLEKNRRWLLAAGAVSTFVSAFLYYNYSYYGDLWVNYVGWNAILVLLIYGKKFLNRRTKFTVYFNRASYPVYILHQSVLVALAYYVVGFCDGTALQAAAICFGSFALTLLTYEAVRHIPGLRRIVGA